MTLLLYLAFKWCSPQNCPLFSYATCPCRCFGSLRYTTVTKHGDRKGCEVYLTLLCRNITFHFSSSQTTFDSALANANEKPFGLENVRLSSVLRSPHFHSFPDFPKCGNGVRSVHFVLHAIPDGRPHCCLVTPLGALQLLRNLVVQSSNISSPPVLYSVSPPTHQRRQRLQ